MLEQVPAPSDAHPAPRRRVLVAEDDTALRRLVELRLSLDPTLEVTAVGDGQATLQAVAQSIPDLLICDIMMPKLSGLGVCRRLRADGVAVPIILLSAQPQDEAVDAVLTLGNIEFMNKPYDAAALSERIATLLGSRSCAPGSDQPDAGLTPSGDDGSQGSVLRHTDRAS